MKNSQTSPPDFSGDQRTNIRMSKVARAIRSAAAETNWTKMAKMLFRADPHQGRQEKIRGLLLQDCAARAEEPGASYSNDELQSILILMLIISIAEKRTQELYQNEFSQRCDEISAKYGLKDDRYWDEGKTPAEWEEVNEQFEQKSLAILLQTMREYGQTAIADLVDSGGIEHFFSIMQSLKGQFMKVLDNFEPGTEDQTELTERSLPETLQQS